MRRVGTVRSSFFVREGKDKDQASFSTNVYPLKNSAILDSGTTIHIFNEITRFTCGQENIKSRLRDMELLTLSSKPLTKIRNSQTKSFVFAMSLSALISQQILHLFNSFTNEDCGRTTDPVTII
jgi:hypothetical protein